MSAGSIAQRSFDSRGMASAERSERWIIAAGGIWDSISTPTGDCLVEARTWPIDRLMLIHSTDHGRRAQARSASAIRRDQLDHYRVVLSLDGEYSCDADGSRHNVAAGQLIVTDLARTESFACDHTSKLVLFVPRSALDELLPRPVDLHGCMPQGAGALLVGDHLRALVRAIPVLTTQELPTVNQATLQLLAAAIAPCAATLGEARPAIQSALLRQAQRCIDTRLGDPELSVEALCGALKISRATLYRMFEAEGGVAQYVRLRRLQRAHTLLATATHRLTIERVAERLGFKHVASFSRTFREHFGYNPSDVGKLGLRNAAVAPKPTGSRSFVDLIHRLA
jgi:AraC-like DNA-binding protein